MTWLNKPMVGFDTETTGVDVDHDRIVTAALVRRSPTGDDVSRWLINPGIDIPEAATAVHGITNEQARTHGRAPREALDEIAASLASALTGGEPIVAFNASFDLTLLANELRRHGLTPLTERIGSPVEAVLDPLVLDRHVERYRRGKRRLVDVCAHYGVHTEGLHSADADVLATLDVLAAMARKHPQLTEASPSELHGHQVAAHRKWAESFNEWRTSRGLTGPGAETDWPCRKATAAGSAHTP